ncbi:MAG: response regulator [Actinomycetota bacterium]|nr:response regulator [Actinomycetota bacterium]
MTLVLVVDDEPSIRALLEVTLQMEGYEVVGASDGETAMQLVTQRRPDVITLDVMMPGMDGWEVARELEGSGIPIVIMSGMPLADLEDGADHPNVAAVLGKPFDYKAFLEVVATSARTKASAR